MSDKIAITIVSASVRRDANTITHVTVPPYELAVLREIHGDDNVQELGAAHAIELDPAEEYKRLSFKYGAGVVTAVFGKDKARVAELAEKAAAKAAKQSKKAAEPAAE